MVARRRRAWAWLASVLALGIVAHGHAAELSGNARVFWGNTGRDLDGTELQEIDVTDQYYTVTLAQPITPFLSILINYRYTDLSTKSEPGTDNRRSSSTPLVELVYDRPTFTMRIQYYHRDVDNTNEIQNIDGDSLQILANYNPLKGPQHAFTYRDDTNTNDVAVFGRDTRTQNFKYDLTWFQGPWDTRYTFGLNKLSNREQDLQIRQMINEARAAYNRTLLDETLQLWGEAWLRFVDEKQDIPSGTAVNRPIPPDQGLWAVDPLPDVGPLAPNPQLIDGDVATPVTPRIEIGGGSTFRNIGVDVGFTRAVSQLEITVDSLSDPLLQWEVWRSPDNFNWQPVTGLVSRWDQSFLRYEIEFPETADRFFKAVNVGINSQATVAVTEIRAFLATIVSEEQDAQSTRFQTEFQARYQPHQKVGATFGLWLRNEDDVAPGIAATQSLQEFGYTAAIRYQFDRHWTGNLHYRFSDFEQGGRGTFEQIERINSASLEWRPIPTVTGDLVLSKSDQKVDGFLIRDTESVRTRFGTQLLKDLHLNSELTWSDADDPLNGFSQETIRWSEMLTSRPKPNWTLSGGFMMARFDSVGTVSLTYRDTVDLRTTWQALRQLLFAATWSWGRDDRQGFLNQSYTISWTPGPKFFVTFTYRDDEATDVRMITVASVNVTYWLNRRLRFNLSAFRSQDTAPVMGRSSTDNVTFGLNFTF